MSKHTPGPWFGGHLARADHPCDCTYILAEPYMGCVAEVRWSGDAEEKFAAEYPDREEAEANIRLISAAPDLLDALRPFADAIQYLHPSHPDDGVTLDGFKVSDVRRAAAAIAKAEGRA